MVGDEQSLKISAPQLLQIGRRDSVWKILNKRMIQLVNELITKVFVEQPQIHLVC